MENGMTKQVNKNENLGRLVVEDLFLLIKLIYPEFLWGFTKGQYDVYDGYTKKAIFDVKYRDIYNLYTGLIYPDIYLSAHKVNEMNRIAKEKNTFYYMVDKSNKDIWIVNLKKCNLWKRSLEWMQTNNYTHEKGWVDVYSIPTSAFTVFSKDENGKYRKIENPV